MRHRYLLLLVLVIAVLLPRTVDAEASGGSEEEVFSGTIREIHENRSKITVENELGRTVVLDVLNPLLLEGIVQGDLVSIEMARPGEVKKITKLSVPELNHPLPSGRP